MTSAARTVRALLHEAGIEVNGGRPWDIRVHDERFYDRVIAQGSLGLGESYMDGWWDVPKLDECMFRLIRARIDQKVPLNFPTIIQFLKSRLLNLQTKRRGKRVGREHYDLGNEFYEALLDPYNQYTCGYFKDTSDLNIAQEQKLHLQCKKLQLKPTDRVLDIGCGWGGFSKFASQHYGCHVTGITISKEQAAYARDFCKGLPVEIIERDYRDMRGSFDKVLVCGMIEHVGYKNYRTMMEVVSRCLKDSGLFLLHTIGGNVSKVTAEPWITKYIFPNSMLPSMTQLTKAFEGLFIVEDWHNFGAYYEQTLLGWYQNFRAHWHRFRARYGDRFERMFEYYLLSCAGAFRARSMQLWQVVLVKDGAIGGYASVR